MIVSSAPYEETGGQPSGARLSRRNAFRVLSLPADAELKKIDRQQRRLLVAIELGELQGTRELNLFPLSDLAKEDVLEAGRLLELPDDRLIEELFWVHEMEGNGDLVEGQMVALRGAAASNTMRGAVARHNLAVIQGVLAHELAGNRRFERWEEALKIWRKLVEEDIFWAFMEDRAGKIECHSADAGMMRAAVCRQLSLTLSGELTRAVKLKELTAVAVLARIAVEHGPWLKLGAALDFVGEQAIKDGFVSLGAILDRLAAISSQGNKANIRNSLLEREKELLSVAAEYGAIVRSLGELADAGGWDDALASSFQKLSVAYFNLLDDPQQALRLIEQARELARDSKLRQSMQRNWQHVQRAVLCRDADVLMQRGDFAAAEDKLAAALPISTEEQTDEIKGMQDRCRRAHVLSGVDTWRNNPIRATFVTNAGFRSNDVHGEGSLSNYLKKAGWGIGWSALVSILVLIANPSGGTFTQSSTGLTLTGAADPAPGAGVTTPPPAVTVDPRQTEKDEIDQERTALTVLVQSLEDRKRKLQAEGVDLDKQKGHLALVASSYASESVPDGGQSRYDAVLANYNSRVQKYDRNLAALKADFVAYNQRVSSLNVRIQLSNGFR